MNTSRSIKGLFRIITDTSSLYGVSVQIIRSGGGLRDDEDELGFFFSQAHKSK